MSTAPTLTLEGVLVPMRRRRLLMITLGVLSELCRKQGLVGVGPAKSGVFVRCLSFVEPELLPWLRARLRTTTSSTAFTTGAAELGRRCFRSRCSA